MKARVALQSFELWTSTSQEFQKVIEGDYARWGKIVKASGARID